MPYTLPCALRVQSHITPEWTQIASAIKIAGLLSLYWWPFITSTSSDHRNQLDEFSLIQWSNTLAIRFPWSKKKTK